MSAMRVLHVMRASGVSGAERQLIDLLLPDELWPGIERELRFLALPGFELPPDLDAADSRCAFTTTPMAGHFSRSVGSMLRRAFKEREIVHTHLVHADWHALVAGAGRSAAWVSSKHNQDAFRSRASFRAVERLVDRRADATIAISASVAEFTEAQTGVRPVTIPYGYAGTPAVRSQPRSAPPFRLLAVGRLVEQKGFDSLVAALPEIARRAPGTRLTVAGDGPQRERLEASARELGVRELIDFAGWAQNVPELMRRHDLLVHPARWEGFGLVLIEAMAEGLPIVGSTAGAIPEVLGPDLAPALVPPDSPARLADVVSDLLARPSRRMEMAAAGVDRVQEAFSMEDSAARMRELYLTVSTGRTG
jgi:glycosyltransferase involved in cell wall biosynthesis